jgi:hypothetical protein
MELRGITQVGKVIGNFISENSPTILTGVAVGGLVTTTLFGITSTPKALSVIDNHVLDKHEELVAQGVLEEDVSFIDWLDGRDPIEMVSRLDAFRLTWRVYLPTIIIGATTIACIIGANHISLRRNAALASLYGITEAALKEYKAKVVETIGKSKELKMRDEISGDQIKRNPPGTNEVIFTGKGEVMCFDTISGRYFKSDIEQIRKAINELNRGLLSDMFVTLNEFYDAIGLANTKLGDDMGWDIDKGMIDVSFSAQLTEDGEPCLVLNYDVEPKYKR